ncbi:hypothetical protein NLJ89_g10300 [Agrocybe chaxingu]|uniref:FAD/NAD(P)-binding domain-containing protein n=1 Tax=Agrocybe chaxingu TaxID=84603 RepID=A0A9W8MQE7_9AGAR|nr:hypothetical protein NLJ89_g10300 [Agrocybe chaxingu]
MGGGMAPTKDTKTVVVLGAAYGGSHAGQILAATLPEGWRVILIDRNSHANHVYVMPRFAVLPGHEYKAFIPYTKVFLVDPPKPEQNIHLQATVTSIRPTHITLSRAFPELGFPTETIPFDYAIYALGAHLPPPLDLWGTCANGKPIPEAKAASAVYRGLKSEGCDWFLEKQKIIENASTVLVVGGGALGIQFATDIKSVYPAKKVTLLHSRKQLLPRYDIKMHEEILRSCENMDIEVILGERLDMDSVEDGKGKHNERGQKVVRTVTGREIAADLLLLCIGQSPNTGLMRAMDPATINEENKLIRVLRTLQVATEPVKQDIAAVTSDLENLSTDEKPADDRKPTTDEKPAEPAVEEEEKTTGHPHIFAIGDSADAFGAIAAGHIAYAQAELAAKNIVRLIQRREAPSAGSNSTEGEKAKPEPLGRYTPAPPAIKVSLGLKRAVYQMGPNFGIMEDGVPDLHAAHIWPFFGIKVEKDEDMRA